MQSLSTTDHRDMRRAMGLSVGVGLAMLLIKITAYLWTNSSAILSDAAESVVHIAAVLFAAYSLWYSLRPADNKHPYGHSKISFFSAGIEGALIMVAAIYIIYTAVSDWITGLSLRNLDVGVALTAFAALLNAGLGVYLIRVGRRKKSIILEANGIHVLTDCWTSAGVVAGLLLAMATGWLFLDPVCAIAVAVNIIFSGVRLIRRSIGGLMDAADPEIQAKVSELLDRECQAHGISHHKMRQRFDGYSHEIDFHLIFPDAMTIKDAHRIATAIETIIKNEIQPSHVVSHLEPHDDHRKVHPNAAH